jgi:hypothetical protein
MRSIPKSKVLTAVEAVLLVAVIATCVGLWGHKTRAIAIRPVDSEKPQRALSLPAAPSVASASLPATTDAGPRQMEVRRNRPSYVRTFDVLFDNPQVNPLHLTNEQVDELIDCCTEFYQDRLTLEASLAQVDQVEGGGVLIGIPAYPDAGKALEQAFMSSMNEKFGEPLAAQIEAQYLQQIESENQYMGKFPQQILASVDPENSGRVKIVHDISDANGSFRSTKISQLSETDFREYGALATYFPKP